MNIDFLKNNFPISSILICRTTCLAGSDGAVVPDLGESDRAEVSHDADLLEGYVVHVLAQQVQLFQGVSETGVEIG